MFIAALFTIAKTWKQPKLSKDRWMDKNVVCVYIHNWIVFSPKKEGNPSVWDNVGGLWGHYSKWNKSDKDKY